MDERSTVLVCIMMAPVRGMTICKLRELWLMRDALLLFCVLPPLVMWQLQLVAV
jgi:hypothetical protein